MARVATGGVGLPPALPGPCPSCGGRGVYVVSTGAFSCGGCGMVAPRAGYVRMLGHLAAAHRLELLEAELDRADLKARRREARAERIEELYLAGLRSLETVTSEAVAA